MVKQVTGSVQWMPCVQWFMGQGVTSYIECGPGKVLAGLIKRIAKDVEAVNMENAASLDGLR